MIKTIVVAILIIASPYAQAQQKLELSQFLEQVQQKHTGFKASKEISEGARLRAKEGEVLTDPTISLSAQNTVDQAPSYTSSLYGNKTTATTYTLGLSQATSFGLTGKLSYNLNYRNIENASASLVPVPTYYTAKPMFELSQSLWRNWFGNEISATRDLLAASARTSEYSERAKLTATLIEAEATYWKLYGARKTVEALKSSLELSEKLKAWASNRANLQLGERSDYLQAKAALELRQLDLIKATEEEKSAARTFNSLRGSDEEAVIEALVDPKIASVTPIPTKWPKFDGKQWRDDVRAARAAIDIARSNAQIGKEKNKPTLELYGSYAYNSLSADQNTAISDSSKSTYPTYAVGVRFSSPLSFGRTSDIREGYEKEEIAADYNFKRKVLEQERDWNDLQSKILNTQERLKLSKILADSQKEKLLSERSRHQKGRTTTSQVILFEQDYITAELNRIRTETELLGLMSQLKLYRGE